MGDNTTCNNHADKHVQFITRVLYWKNITTSTVQRLSVVLRRKKRTTKIMTNPNPKQYIIFSRLEEQHAQHYAASEICRPCIYQTAIVVQEQHNCHCWWLLGKDSQQVSV
jgi:hypothetical protein